MFSSIDIRTLLSLTQEVYHGDEQNTSRWCFHAGNTGSLCFIEEEDDLTLHNLCKVSSFLVRDDMHSE